MKRSILLLAAGVLVLVGVLFWLFGAGTADDLEPGRREVIQPAPSQGIEAQRITAPPTRRSLESSGPSSGRSAPRSSVIRGVVLSADAGRPVAGVEVRALDRHPAFAGFEVRLRDLLDLGFWKPRPVPEVEVLAMTRSAADGSFEFEGLQDGRIFLDARSSSWHTRTHPAVRLARGELREEVRVLVSPGGRVQGRVLDVRGEPVEDATVALRPSATAFLAQITSRRFRWFETRTDPDGRFDFVGVPEGNGYSVTATGPGMVLAQARDLVVEVGRPVDLTLRGTVGATIEGTVYRPDGEPASGAHVGFAYLDLARVLFSIGPENPVRVGPDGHFRIEQVGPGEIALSALVEGLAFAPVRRVHVVPGATYQLDLTLSEGLQIQGRVVNHEGQPVEGATVSLRSMEAPQGFDLALITRLVRFESTTGADGRFSVLGLASERVFLQATHEDYLPSQRRFRRTVEEPEVEIILQPGVFVTGTVVDEDRNAVTRFRVRPRSTRDRRVGVGPRWGRPPRDGNPFSNRSPWRRGGEFEVQDPAGQFRVGPLAPGKMRLSVDAEGFVTRESREVELELDKELDVGEFQLTRGAVLRGQVLGLGGEPVPEAQVTWRRHRERDQGFLPFQITAEPEDLDFMAMDSTFGSRSVITDARGQFELRGVALGTIDLTARHPSYAKSRLQEIEVLSSEIEDGLVIQLGSGGAIEGTVSGLDGRPAKSAMVVAFSIPNGVVKSAVTNENGHYRMDALVPGPYVLFKTKFDASLPELWTNLVGNVRLKSATVREGRTSRVDIQDRSVGGTDVFGTVHADGQPVPKAVITLLGQDRDGPFGVGMRTTSADKQGAYELPSVPPGNYMCRVTRYTSRRPVSASLPFTVPEKGGRVRIDLEFPSGSIRGVVVDPTGRPLEGVRLRATQEDGGAVPGGLIGMVTEMGGTSRGRTDPEGRFSISRLAPGTWTIRAEPTGEAGASHGAAEVKGLALGAGQAFEGLRIVLPRASSVAGRVVDSQGQPMGGVAVRLLPGGANHEETAVSDPGTAISRLARDLRFVARSSNDGSFRLRGVVSGTWRVVAEKEGLSAPQQLVHVQIGQEATLTIQMLRAGHLWLRVLDVNGKGLPTGEVRVLDSTGAEVGGRQSLLKVMASLFRNKKDDGDTEWMDFGELAPDTYTLEVKQVAPDGDPVVRRVTRTLREGEQARWEVRLKDLVK